MGILQDMTTACRQYRNPHSFVNGVLCSVSFFFFTYFASLEVLGSAEFFRCILKTFFFSFVVTMAVFLHWVHPRFLSEATGHAEYQSAYKQLGGVSRVMAFVWERACSWGAHTHIQNNFLSSIMKRYYGKSICLWLVFFSFSWCRDSFLLLHVPLFFSNCHCWHPYGG